MTAAMYYTVFQTETSTRSGQESGPKTCSKWHSYSYSLRSQKCLVDQACSQAKTTQSKQIQAPGWNRNDPPDKMIQASLKPRLCKGLQMVHVNVHDTAAAPAQVTLGQQHSTQSAKSEFIAAAATHQSDFGHQCLGEARSKESPT